MLQLGHTNASPVWPPSGLAFATLLIFGAELWPGIAIGAFLANIAAFYENHVTGLPAILTTSLFICIGNTLEALSGYYLLKRFNAIDIMNRARDFASFFISALLMCMVSAGIGVTILSLNNIIPWAEYGTVWFTWWMGDVSGVIVLTPVLLSLKMVRFTANFRTSKAIQIILLFMALGIYLSAVFGGWLPIGLNKAKIFFIFFILIWCAFRMNQWQSSLVVLFLSVVTIWGTLKQMGPFIENSQNDSFLSMQVFLCIASVTMMFLSTTLQQRRRVEQNLKEANTTLERKVTERTEAIEKQKEELKQANAELKIKTSALEEANKDSRFFAHLISHDLREPLRSISGFMELLESKYKGRLDKNADEYIQFAIDGAARMNALIEDMLIYSRLEHSRDNFKEVSIKDVMTVVLDNLHGIVTHTQADIVVGDNLPTVFADFSQMVQLFQNLVDNAVKYKGDTLPRIKVSASRQDKNWLFSIEDNGIGIPDQYKERVFVMFQRLHTRDKYEGTGVGLAICKKIVERHGGTIWAEPALKGGTIFHFTIPI